MSKSSLDCYKSTNQARAPPHPKGWGLRADMKLKNKDLADVYAIGSLGDVLTWMAY